jgi:hypothetical protein
LSRKLEKISFRDVGRAYRTLRDDADSIQAAMDALTMAGWVEPIDPDRFGRAKKWAVNPAVHGQFVKEAKAEKLRREEELARIQESIQTLGLTNKEEAA